MTAFGSLKKYLELIKFSHSLFALPFALVSTLLALRQSHQLNLSPETLKIIGWIVLAMVGARSGAMGFNRLADRKWDAANPRTSSRPSVTGEIQPYTILVMVVISFAVLVFASWNLNRLAFVLSPVAILLVCFYSYTKRFTDLSHLFLGLAIGSAPVAAWIAVTGTISFSSLTIGLSVLTWIAGFDVLYALQDLEFDKSAALHSIPVKFGINRSLIIARILHSISTICWILLWYLENLHTIYAIGIAICILLLFWEHSLLKRNDLSKLNVAFFNMNAIISLMFFFTFTFDFLLL